MTDNDLLRASPAKLKELACFYGLRPHGTQSIYWVRKSVTHPLTRKQHFFKWSTQTADLRTALLRAVPRVEEFMARIQTHLETPVRSTNGLLTLAELHEAYLSAPTVRANAAVRRRNWADLMRIIRLVHGAEIDEANATVGLINRELAKEYQRRRQLAVVEEAKGNKLTIEAAKRAMNSTLAHAQSVFSRAALEDYHMLRLPATVRDFADALPVAARSQEEPQPLNDQLVVEILGKLATLKSESPAAWAVFELMLWGGLRNIDAFYARSSWLVKEESGYRINLVPTEEYTPKGRSGSVVIPTDVGDAILALPRPSTPVVELPADGKPDDPYLVPASNKTARHDACYRTLNKWLKVNGVPEEASKVAYRLRKYFLRKVADQQGRLMAQLAARHADASTTAAHYIGAEKMQKPIAL